MEFLVRITTELSPLSGDREEGLRAAEAARGGELLEQGAIVRIWRLPGCPANVGIWCAPDATALHDLLESLPLHPWQRVEVTALAQHPLEAGRGD